VGRRVAPPIRRMQERNGLRSRAGGRSLLSEAGMCLGVEETLAFAQCDSAIWVGYDSSSSSTAGALRMSADTLASRWEAEARLERRGKVEPCRLERLRRAP
jgi:hypothetical protein